MELLFNATSTLGLILLQFKVGVTKTNTLKAVHSVTQNTVVTTALFIFQT
jgi:hypothetical protein